MTELGYGIYNNKNQQHLLDKERYERNVETFKVVNINPNRWHSRTMESPGACRIT